MYAYEIPKEWRASKSRLRDNKYRERIEFVDRIREVFRRMDQRRTGQIGPQEFKQALFELGLHFTDVEVATVFLESNAITYPQFKKVMVDKRYVGNRDEPDGQTASFRRFLGLGGIFDTEPGPVPWVRTTLASGFKVKRLGINPGAPGFVYTFYPHQSMKDRGFPPHILLSGDCSDAAYVFRPFINEDGLQYDLMATIGVDGTVGSIAVGYKSTPGYRDDGWAKIFVPVYEKDRVYVIKCGP